MHKSANYLESSDSLQRPRPQNVCIRAIEGTKFVIISLKDLNTSALVKIVNVIIWYLEIVNVSK